MKRIGQVTFGLLFCGTFAALCAVAGLAADEKAAKPDAITPQQVEFFEAKVRPVLFHNCFGCHGAKQQMGGLRLDSLTALLKGGNRGPALVPGDVQKSLLVQAVHYDTALKMPPTGKLKAEEIAALTEWIKMGAPWPGAKVSEEAKKAAQNGDYVITEEQRRFWSFRPIRKPPLPKVKNAAWVKSPIDRFILAKLEPKKLTPAKPADRRTLIRRVTFDLIGLPPTPEEVDAFLADKSPNAFAKVVDRLLASPRYGERWGRHWLDVARYADTKGYVFTEDAVYHNAYTYRDYVIRAFNQDLPYNQFILQQLAADRLPLGEDRRSLAALGFLTVGRRFLNDPVLINDDRIDVTTRGLMGLTVACARCHNHKFDPIPTKDYYSLYGVFASSIEPNPPPAISPKAISEPYEAYNAKKRDAEGRFRETVQAQVRRLRGIVEKNPEGLPKEIKDTLQAFREGTDPDEKQLKKLEPQFEAEAQAQLKTLRETLEALKKNVPPTPEFAMALQDAPTPVEPHVFIRGNAQNQGDAVPRRFLAILSGPERKPFTQGSGRLELAQAIASRDNPLTARVLVNRVWLYHFGEGLVRTPSDFGTRGEPPTHSELLDWLAATFMEQGWSIKKLHRLILLSSAYQQSSDSTPRARLLDSENRLLSHQNRQRLDLEALRDSLLAVSGQLDLKMGGPSVELTTAPYATRRTVYGFIDRQNLQGLYRTFDFASPDTTSAQRHHTTVPQQALFMMNSPFVVEQAQHLARRPDIQALPDEAARIRAVYRLLFGRVPTKEETALGLAFLRSAGPQTATLTVAQDKTKAGGKAPLTAWDKYLQTLLMTNEFSFVD
ncbi:MAG TPA: PSD1 and planctomycete cytochrome C domain-containing protein [Chthonomonadaceae bacterium]|nr:PSD1 and planctomycete cytochrome C domain-containing protein [Chthonomonadaceae bacterium]